jgi:hypothetical protein
MAVPAFVVAVAALFVSSAQANDSTHTVCSPIKQ